MTALEPWAEQVRPEWIDYNGHLSEAYYVLVFGHATDSVMAQIGMTSDYLERTHTSLFTLEAHVRYLDQVPPGAGLRVESSVIGVSAKALWLWHDLYAQDRLRATEEILALHVDTEAGRGAPMPAGLAERLAALEVPPPAAAGRRIQLR